MDTHSESATHIGDLGTRVYARQESEAVNYQAVSLGCLFGSGLGVAHGGAVELREYLLQMVFAYHMRGDDDAPVLVIVEISDEDIVIFEITGGSLKKGSTSKTQRFEFRKLPSGDEFIMALHDFEPALPWPVFKMTQAPIHSLVSRIYQVEMIINKDVPEHRPHNNK